MEIKEMLDFLIKFRSLYKDIENSPFIIYADQMDNIITLLQQGEAYRQIINTLKKNGKDVWFDFPGHKYNVPRYIEELEQKYLKEAKDGS